MDDSDALARMQEAVAPLGLEIQRQKMEVEVRKSWSYGKEWCARSDSNTRPSGS
jgi:hypothetical protein